VVKDRFCTKWAYIWGPFCILYIFALVVIGQDAAAQPNEKCTQVRDQLATGGGAAPLVNILTKVPLSPGDCGTAQGLGGKVISHCALPFEYRSDVASQVLEQLLDGLSGCLERDATFDAGDPVNHPDSFVQHRFVHPHRKISLSIKDKAARSQTFVFLRVETAP